MSVPTRRFGKTELQMPVITCGGMRYQQSWNDETKDRDSVTEDNQKNLEACIRYALDLGVSHIETARGYGTSEYQLGKLLPTLPRDEMIIQTKVGPKDSPAEFLEAFETSMSALKLEYVDLLSIHGINNDETLEKALKSMPALQQLKKEGRCRHIGFSTHGPPDTVVKAIETGLFEYVNLHWYFVYHPVNWAPVEAATRQDMGVFIISPVDKGGMLYQPPVKLIEACQPLTPIQFNDLYCLRRPEVHTLSIGPSRPSDFVEHVAAVQDLEEKLPMVEKIEQQLVQCLEKTLGADWVHHWHKGLPRQIDTPGDINIPEILRLWTFAKGLDMVDFGKMRYNLLGNAEHWFPGQKAANVDDEALKPFLENSPFAKEIPGILREAHALLNAEEQKRLSES
ncbi:aldo/keto reductase [Tichowtungia aerotolerans]|uniref:Aldo/keto reductase n=1 Tax=Tichowtungia aerotolerans TaxID=2697043 RepID=A0A6P1M6N6_9BACT|nr:aldo/keto reductase [Tichowtungia aerotolerans]QHI69517.1 aldo/keto reductase [Tichowtungia aerotolerans]